MPKVVSYEEYQSLKKTEVIAKKRSPEPAPQKAIKTNKEYLFFHPDNSETNKVNGKFLVEDEGKIIEIPIEQGILKTADEKIKNILMMKGMIFTHEREVINE
jgi:hypothetical protein